MTKIQWTDKTWNPVTGCTKLPLECDNCYAERMTRRLEAMGLEKYKFGFKPHFHPETLAEPLKWRKPCRCFVCSMSDLFNERIHFRDIDSVMDVIKKCPHITFQILTKRSDRMKNYFHWRDVPNNCWIGVTLTYMPSAFRIEDIKNINAPVRFVSFEPLIDVSNGIKGLELMLCDMDWVIVGGETGPGKRPMYAEQAIRIRKACLGLGIPFFYKKNNARIFARSEIKTEFNEIVLNTQEFPNGIDLEPFS